MSIFHHDHPTTGGAPKPTVFFVHGAFADSSGWAAAANTLSGQGFPVVAVANPLRDLSGDADYVHSVLETIEGPVVLVGHSYAGAVITEAVDGIDNVVALVYVAAFIPERGESSGQLNGRFPGSLLTPENLITRTTADGRTDLYIRADRYADVYAGGLAADAARDAAFGQRPITAEALGGATTVDLSTLPKWQIVATADHAVPTELQRFMAQRAGATVIEADCGHDVPAARPHRVVEAVLAAAAVGQPA